MTVARELGAGLEKSCMGGGQGHSLPWDLQDPSSFQQQQKKGVEDGEKFLSCSLFKRMDPSQKTWRPVITDN